MEQLSIFDTRIEDNNEVNQHGNQNQEYNPCDYALVYLVTKNGGAQGNLWVLKTDDAMKLCEDECSHGRGRGGEWMFNWTSLSHFANNDAGAAQHKDVHGKLQPFVFLFDTGKQDKDFERLMIEKPYPSEVASILSDLGYRMTYKNAEQEKLTKEGEEIIRKMGDKRKRKP